MERRGHRFVIPVSWAMCGNMHIYAESLEEALDKAGDVDLPFDNASYMEGSFEIDEECAEANNAEIIKKIKEESVNPINSIINKAFPNHDS